MPRVGEITLKLWVESEAQRTGQHSNSIRRHLYQGKYPEITKQMRRVNAHVIYLPESVLTKENK